MATQDWNGDLDLHEWNHDLDAFAAHRRPTGEHVPLGAVEAGRLDGDLISVRLECVDLVGRRHLVEATIRRGHDGSKEVGRWRRAPATLARRAAARPRSASDDGRSES